MDKKTRARSADRQRAVLRSADHSVEKQRLTLFDSVEVGSMRAETGTIKFGNDWRAIHIRGDDAFGYAVHLRRVVALGSTPRIAQAILMRLVDLLESADERRPDETVQRLKPFEQCKADQ